MDLLVLADRDGVIDMTMDAIARRTNVPITIIDHAISVLMQSDTSSRSDLEEGRRLVLLDSHRDWGWQIVNYDHYRRIRDEEARKAYFRDYKREYRQKHKENSPQESTPVQPLSTPVLDSPTMSTKAEAKAEANTDTKATTSSRVSRSKGTRFPEGYQPNEDHKALSKELGIDLRAEFPKFRDYWVAKAGKEAVKLDWDATLRNWIRNAADRRPTRNGQLPNSKVQILTRPAVSNAL
jgi:hypothetical protein